MYLQADRGETEVLGKKLKLNQENLKGMLWAKLKLKLRLKLNQGNALGPVEVKVKIEVEVEPRSSLGDASYIQKAGDAGDISPPIFLDFPPNFRLSTRN